MDLAKPVALGVVVGRCRRSHQQTDSPESFTSTARGRGSECDVSAGIALWLGKGNRPQIRQGVVVRRMLLTGAVMLIPIAGLAFGFAGTAGAAGGKMECSAISGNESSTVTLSGCSGVVIPGGVHYRPM